MDNDATMLEQMGTALTNLQIKYRASNLADRMALRPDLDKLLQQYTDYQARLLNEGIVTTDDDLAAMAQIKTDIDKAAQKEELAEAIINTAAFIAKKMA
ncbi:MAG TPA: hypothetical protein VJT54_04785 [Verrucomicrobiae bacterium]|nr:hypothetical protein [Verrucomicrobiae bacterium]